MLDSLSNIYRILPTTYEFPEYFAFTSCMGLLQDSRFQRQIKDGSKRNRVFLQNRRHLPIIALTLLWLVWSILPAHAETPQALVKHPHSSIGLIPGPLEKEENGTVIQWAGLDIQLEEHWKTYWRAPGDAGQPISLTWDQSENISSVTLMDPAPTRYVEDWGLESFGYADQVVFPLKLTLKDPSKPATLTLGVEYTVCYTQCIPFSATVAYRFAPDLAISEPDTAKFEAYQRAIPGSNGSFGMTIESASIDEGGESPTLTILAVSAQPFTQPDLFVEGPPLFRFPKPEVSIQNDGNKATFSIHYEQALGKKSLQNKELKLTLVNGEHAIEASLIPEFHGPVTVAEPAKNLPPMAENTMYSLPLILLFAFLGGLILNVMPCVLPVLSLKVMGVLKYGGSHPGQIRLGFLLSAAGILASFLGLAATVLFLQQLGEHVGWGFHFQEPAFLIGLSLILVLFASNLWGHFEINLPGKFGNKLAETSAEAEKHSVIGHFFTGALATLLATPCTAPFLGTAVGFALARGTEEVLLTFTFIGLGLASPYILIAFFPRMVSILPKPGAWMLTVKHLFGFLLLITAGWLIWVLSNQIGKLGAVIVLCLQLAILFKILLLRTHPLFGSRKIMFPVIALLAFLAFLTPRHFHHQESLTERETTELWQPFDESRIPNVLSKGFIVLVDVTADWCITCKANKALVLDTPEIEELLKQPNVIAMRADWTSPRPEITQFLNRHGRYGVPFNIVYGPEAPNGIPLSEVLTTGSVEDAIHQAGLKE